MSFKAMEYTEAEAVPVMHCKYTPANNGGLKVLGG